MPQVQLLALAADVDRLLSAGGTVAAGDDGLRRGQTLDGKQEVKPPSGVLSTAEAISLLGNSMALAGHFGSGTVTDRDLAAGLQGVVVKEDTRDAAVWVEYLENIMKKHGAEWRELYNACKELA